MGHQIIRQPNGMLCVFSTITRTFIIADATPEYLREFYAEQAAAEARERTRKITEAIINGEPQRVYYQFVMTYDEAVELHQKHGGDEEMICDA